MKIAVTGGAGFIGANLVGRLEASQLTDEIVVVDDLSTGTSDNLHGIRATFIPGSILDPDVLNEAIDGADAVVHLAAIPSVPRSLADPLRSHHANVTGTLAVLETVRRQRRPPHLVVASSSSVYGANRELPKSESARTAPMSPYAVSKLAAEQYALAYAHCFDVDVLPFRFFNVFGPLQPAGHAYAAVVPTFTDAALDGRPVDVHGDGEQTRDFTYVGSVCDVLVQALARRVTSESPVNLAFGTRTTLNSLIDMLDDIIGTPVDRRYVSPRPGDVRDSQADPTLLRSLFPEAEPVPLRSALETTVEWFRAQRTSGRAGDPTTTTPGATSRVTTAPAPTYAS